MSCYMKIKAFIERHFYIFLIFCGLLLTSCEFFNKSIPEFLEYYTSEAMVLDYNFACTVLKNKNSVDCIPSNNIVEVVFNLANLKQYDIDFSYDFDDEFIKSKYVEKDITFNLSADKTSVTMKIKKDFLQKIDKGQAKNAEDEITKNISGTLTLFQLDDSENRVRPFEMPYSMTLNANSAPSRVDNACILADGVSPSSGEDTRNLYICFNLENFKNTVHENDTHKITIAGDEYTISYDSGMVLSSTDTDVNAKLLTSAPDSLYEIAETDSGATKSLPDNSTCKKYYYKLDIDAGHVDKNKKYEIKVTDDWGLSSSASVSANSEKLTQPVITASEYDNNKEKGHIIISHDHKTLAGNYCTGELKIKYSIYDASGNTKGELVAAPDPVVMKNGTYDIYVEPGKYIIEATAVCEDYIDSALTTSAVIDAGERSKVYYVSSDGNANNNGSFEYPYPSISECMNAIQKRNASSGDEYTIKLKSNIKEYGIEFNNLHLGSVSKIVLDGCGHSIKANEEWNILSVGSGIDVALTDVTLTGAGKEIKTQDEVSPNISVSGNLYLCNGTKVVNNFNGCNGAGSYTSSLISVGAGGQLFAEGKVIISGNKFADGNNLASNLYLQRDQVIKCFNKMKDENDNYYSMERSEIHVSLCDELNETTNKSQTITKNFKSNAGFNAEPSIFVSDQEYSATRDSSNLEVCFCKNAIETQIQNFEDIQICTDRKVIPVVPTGATSVDSLRTVNAYVTHNGKRVEATNWSIVIYSGGGPLTGSDVTSSTSSIQFNNDLTESEYQLLISATYKGKPYNVYKTIKAVQPTVFNDHNVTKLKDLMEAPDADEKIIKLPSGTGTVYFTDTGWLPVDEFKGVLDGNGRTIKMPKQNDSSWDAGLVVTNKGVIQNITIEIGDSKDFNYNNKMPNYGCISSVNYGTIKNCRSTGSLKVGTYSDVGGICRVNYGLIENCYSDATITNDNTESFWKGDYGMIAGIAAINGSDDMVGIIRNCVFNGTLYTPRTFAQYDSANGRFGAIAGRNGLKGVIENCYWKENCVIWRQGNYDSGTDLYYNKVAFFFTDYGFNGCNKDECLGTVSGCGYFANTSSNVQAGSVAECKTNQSLISGASGNVYKYLNKYVDSHPDDGLKKWNSDLSYQ